MIKLFVVDDENIISDGISNMNWEQWGISCIGRATNGETAFDMIKECNPDIVISDINMPKKDGIWLAERISNIMPHIKVIFLSGHNDFDYAKKAIKYNVREYILKPINQDGLVSAVIKVKDEVLDELNTKSKFLGFENYIKESKQFMCEWFFRNTETVLDENKLREKLDLIDFTFINGSYYVIEIQFSNQIKKGNEEISYYKFFSGIEKLLELNQINKIGFFNGDSFTYVFNFNCNTSEKEIFGICDKIKEYIDFNYSGIYSIGIGNKVYCLNDLSKSREEAREACKYTFYIGDNQIIYINDITNVERNEKYFRLDAKEYSSAIKVGNEELLKEEIDKLFSKMINNYENIENVKRVCLELIVYTSNAIYELGLQQEMLFRDRDLFAVINNASSINEMQNLIYNINRAVIAECNDRRNNVNIKIIEQVKKIISEQYCQGITLESIAEQIYLSPNYLSVVFSKSTGVTFKDYIINYRILKAKELLKDQSLKIYQISELVGYTDWRYFSEIFKRYTGQSPAQFRTLSNY